MSSIPDKNHCLRTSGELRILRRDPLSALSQCSREMQDLARSRHKQVHGLEGILLVGQETFWGNLLELGGVFDSVENLERFRCVVERVLDSYTENTRGDCLLDM
jgi:hypothetical protein